MRRLAAWPAVVGVAALAGLAHGQTYSLDDNPFAANWGLVPFGPAGFGCGAEDPYGIGLPATMAGLIGPSPSLAFSAFGLFDGELFQPGVITDVVPPNGFSLDALSADHPWRGYYPPIQLKFSVDRGTTGLPGTPLALEAGFNQAPADLYTSTKLFHHPGNFVGLPAGGAFVGGLPSVIGGPNSNVLTYDDSFFGLTPGLGAGNLLGPGVAAPPIIPGSHDNLDAYNDLPTPLLDVNGDQINDTNYFFSISPDEAFAAGINPGDILDVAAGAGGTAPVPYATAFSIGLDMYGQHGTDDIDALILWDNGIPLGPMWGGPGGEPGIDFALFSLANGSSSLLAIQGMGLPVDGSSIFFTDFNGSFALYAFGSDLGVLDMLMSGEPLIANIDALEIIPAPGTLALIALSGLVIMHRRRH